jgi:hypothetical protein
MTRRRKTSYYYAYSFHPPGFGTSKSNLLEGYIKIVNTVILMMTQGTFDAKHRN